MAAVLGRMRCMADVRPDRTDAKPDRTDAAADEPKLLSPAPRTRRLEECRRLEWRCLLAPLRFVGMLNA
jgi:hypothetical protein